MPTERHFVTDPSGLKIKHKGVFDLNNIYNSLAYYLYDYGLCKNLNTLEKRYAEKLNGPVKNIEIEWETSKQPEGSTYFKYVIKIKFLLLGISEIEMQKGDRKIKAHKGDFEAKIIAYVEAGGEEFDKLGFLGKLYANHVIRKRLDEYKIDLYSKVYKLHDFLKRLLGVYRY